MMIKQSLAPDGFVVSLQVAAKGAEVGIPAPTHAALTEVVKRVERGEIEAHTRNVETL
jgi:hypothetical protein